MKATESRKIGHSSERPLIFVSHDARDAKIAKAFCKLLEESSVHMLRTFCSSDRTGPRGIVYGAQWYQTILDNLVSASEVVCLLTPRSINKPWILYEAGFAAGSLNTPVRGLVLGLRLSEVTQGPFAQLQNCDGKPDEIAALVVKMMKRLVPISEPSEDLIRPQVDAFVRTITPLLKRTQKEEEFPKGEKEKVLDSTLAAARILEEIKEVVSGLPSRLEAKLPRSDIMETALQELREAIKTTHEVKDSTKQALKADSEELHNRIEEIHTIVREQLGKIPAISALLKCGILNIHEDRPSAENHIIDVLARAKHHIEVIGISLRSLFQGGGKLNKTILNMLANAADTKCDAPKWRVMVLDPESEQARYRSEREEPLGRKLQDGNLFREVDLTIKFVDDWRKRGCSIELRAYRGSPSCFLMIIDNVIFVEQYHYGRAGGARVAELVPLLEFSEDSNAYRELLGHFDYMWEMLSRPMP